MAACPEQPDLTDPMIVVGGGPFYDCNLGIAGLRAPSPTNLPHAFGDGGLLDGTVLCIQPFAPQGWWGFDLPDIPITDSNREIHNSATFSGDVIFEGHHVAWWNEPGVGVISGEYVCAPSASMIEVDGECLCPVPEPGLHVALMVGLLGLRALARRRGE